MKAEQILRYRKPWILVDNIVEISAGKRIVTQKLITSSDYFLQGHFPQYSIYPGMLVIEGLKQSTELLFKLSGSACCGKKPRRMLQLTARFAKPLEPGDTVTYTVTHQTGKEKECLSFSCKATVGEDEVVRARITMEKEGCSCRVKS
ncbi:beta-hydroxyacyl-ACP dehydratase [Brevibacillus humidisoli]|uniref:3-hydroxyacyl-ACP dehydratase FabZ family protein n=1 Tax=Brevibacillus humidisoli TaxID=2895522 RepID=UPI001E3BC4D3|nr:3-hydroxyacyl-ACP dehydratase FabZ family protein [Brevibacillus humidisoli]UFJ42410.1 beta-hydroxyacyl-ACP dehydratase [Brevibacillus humidisoli]